MSRYVDHGYGSCGSVAILLTICVASLTVSWADEPRDTVAESAPPKFYAFVNLGTYDAEEDLGLLGSASYEFQLAGGFGHQINRYFAGEVEFGVMGREHEVPASLFPDTDDPTLGIAWLSYSILARVPVGKFEPFFGLGVGSGQADLSIASEDFLGPPELEIDDDSGVLFFYRVGFDARLGKRHRVGMELRRVDFEANLGAFTNGKKDIGGTGALFTYRYLF